MKPSKEKLKNWVREFLKTNPKAKVLDLGSGTSNNFVEILEEFPDFVYVAVEPWKVAADKARELTKKFGDRVKVYDQAAYKTFEVTELDGLEFDLVISLSTLEHVKWLNPFLDYSAKMVKKGGTVLHLWDNAHANMPINIKEKIQVFVSNYFPFIMPASRYVAYVPLLQVRKYLESKGLAYVDEDYNNSKTFLSTIKLVKDAFTKEEILGIAKEEELLSGKLVKVGAGSKIEQIFMSSTLIMKK